MRYIDSILQAVEDHPYLSPVEKVVLRNRIDVKPTSDELNKAKLSIEGNGGAPAWDKRTPITPIPKTNEGEHQ